MLNASICRKYRFAAISNDVRFDTFYDTKVIVFNLRVCLLTKTDYFLVQYTKYDCIEMENEC